MKKVKTVFYRDRERSIVARTCIQGYLAGMTYPVS